MQRIRNHVKQNQQIILKVMMIGVQAVLFTSLTKTRLYAVRSAITLANK